MVTVGQYIREYRKLGFEKGNRQWYIKLNDNNLKITGIHFNDLFPLKDLQLYKYNHEPVLKEDLEFIFPGEELDQEEPVTFGYLREWVYRIPQSIQYKVMGSTFRHTVYCEGLLGLNITKKSSKFSISIGEGIKENYPEHCHIYTRHESRKLIPEKDSKLYFFSEGQKTYITKKDLIDLVIRAGYKKGPIKKYVQENPWRKKIFSWIKSNRVK